MTDQKKTNPTKRKGARWLDLGQERWSYYVGKTFVEITSPEGRKSLVRKDKLSRPAEDDIMVTMPGLVSKHIRTHLRA